MRLSCALLLAAAAAQDDASPPPALPLQFRAVLETTAHLVNRSESYPPWRRRIEIDYDYVNKRARAAITEGYEQGRTYVRRYDRKSEYMVKGAEADARCEARESARERTRARIRALAHGLARAPTPLCLSPAHVKRDQRAYLGESMPMPELPREMRRGAPAGAGGRAVVDIDGVACEHWVEEIAGFERTHVCVGARASLRRPARDARDRDRARVSARSRATAFLTARRYVEVARGVPRRLVNEAIEPGGEATPLMTYDLLALEQVAPAESVFDLPAPWEHKTCERQVGGFPYLHVFHHFVRF